MTPQDLLASLDRCEHGRHARDHCLACPGGQSTGNLLLAPGTIIGHTVHGIEIIVPEPSKMHRAEEWLERA